MRKLYLKNELWFALAWIGAYIMLLSAADALSAQIGIEKLLTAPLCLLMTLFLLHWLKKYNLTAFYGLKKAPFPHRSYLFFLPLALLVSVNLWHGITFNLSLPETALYIISMLCVGFLEEIIFRGFLFQALRTDHVKQAILISSITFGIGHIVNLANGAEFFPTLLQIIYAISAGYLFTIIFYRSGSLLPCIAAHSLLNSLSVFSAPPTPAAEIVSAAALTIVAFLYARHIDKNVQQIP